MNNFESLEIKIAKLLRVGVIISGILMFIGQATQFHFSGNPFYIFDTYDQIPLNDLIKFHIKRQNWGILTSYAGLITLISLPIIRVVLTAFLFIKQKEYLLAAIAFLVLIGLALSVTLGLGH